MAVEVSKILSEKKERREKGSEERGVRTEEEDKVRWENNVAVKPILSQKKVEHTMEAYSGNQNV